MPAWGLRVDMKSWEEPYTVHAASAAAAAAQVGNYTYSQSVHRSAENHNIHSKQAA